MRVPPFERYVRFLSGLGLLLAGAVIGSALFMGIYQQNFSQLVLDNQKLGQENAQLKREVDSLNKNKNRQSVVGKIVVNVAKVDGETDPLDESIATEIKKRVYADLQVLIGQPLSAIAANPQLYQNLVDKKIYTGVHEKDYVASLKTMMISPSQLTVWITIRPFARN